MEGVYGIYKGQKCLGQVKVSLEGLYYLFTCRCHLSDSAIYKINLKQGEKIYPLGIPAPEKGEMVLKTRKPAKQFEKGTPEFSIQPLPSPKKFVPIFEDEPFPYLTQIKNAELHQKDGQIGILIEQA